MDIDAALRFGRYALLPARRQLLMDGVPVAIGSRALDLLQVLIARRDRTVLKSELLDLVWPDVVVEEGNLHVQVSALRKLLGGQVIVTVPGRGYRFVASLEDEPARTPSDPNDTSAKGSMRDRTSPPGSAASATIPQGPAASRQTPHSTIATRPAAASVSRQ